MSTPNNKPAKFSYGSFRSRSGSDLVAYMEPIVNDPASEVAAEEIRLLAADIGSFDEYHLVYAIEVGIDRAPEIFAPLLPVYLANESIAVCCAADRALRRIPAHYISEQLLDQIRSMAVNDVYREDPSTTVRGHCGNNAPVIASILAHLTMRVGDQ